jgi:hypothetical protein
MTPAETMRRQLAAQLPGLKSGALRIWGQWFGRPYDNCHIARAVSIERDALAIHFHGGEILLVWDPADCVFDSQRFEIGGASRVRWEWFFYGREHFPENLHQLDYRLLPEGVILDTNWPEPGRRIAPDGPAVELL